MRNEPSTRIEKYRKRHPMLGPGEVGRNFGYFERGPLRIISSGTPEEGSDPWEHVSVSCADRCPTWDEMKTVKEMFWQDSETVVQFHPKKSQYVNSHPFCLHLWRNTKAEHELPPTHLVG